MKRTIFLLLIMAFSLPCFAEPSIAEAEKLKKAQAAPPSFRDRYNAVAKIVAPALGFRECITKKTIGRNHDTIIDCPLVSAGSQLTVAGLNNLITSALLDIDVQKLNSPGDLMKAGRIFLRLARGKDFEKEDPVEMMQLVIEAQESLGKGACVDTPEQRTRFCIMTDDKKVYQFAIIDPDMWK